MEVVIITGMSGAGKSQAIECFEDKGYYCIDNMPPSLIKNFITLSMSKENGIDKAAFVVDIRGGRFFEDLVNEIKTLQDMDVDYKILFLEASDSVLARRFNETRRVHPLTMRSATVEDIKKERQSLRAIRDSADFIIDTSNMKTAKLKKEIMELFSGELQKDVFVINLMSFGFKHGMPITADMVFDLRFIPNPFYIQSLKKATGNNKKVRDYVMKYEEIQTFIENLDQLINNIIPGYIREGKFHLNVAFGCTGGQHRSVAIANEFVEIFEKQGKKVTLEHRDINK